MLVNVFGFFLPLMLTMSTHSIILIFCGAYFFIKVFGRMAFPRGLLVLLPFCLSLLFSGILSGGGALWASTYVAVQFFSCSAISMMISDSLIRIRLYQGLAVGAAAYFLANLFAVYYEPSGGRHDGLFSNSNAFASSTACVFVLLHVMFNLKVLSASRIINSSALLSMFGLAALLVLSGSRAGLLSIVLYLAAYGVVSPKKGFKFLGLIVVIAPLVLVLFGGHFEKILIFKRFGVALSEFFGRGSNVNLEALEVQERFNLVDKAIQGWLGSPLLGNGIGTFKELTGYSYAHNTYADLLYSLGVSGFLTFSMFFLFSLLGWKKSHDPDFRGAFIPVFIFVFWYSFFIPVHQILPFSLMFGFLLSFSMKGVERE